MNSSRFIELLQELTTTAWQAVIDGQSILLQDDQDLTIGETNAANAIIGTPDAADDATPEALRQASLAEAEAILANYYLTHPLTRAGFAVQVQSLMTEQGAMAFAAAPGQLPLRTLFVDGGVVVAEQPDSPRHRYGAYCELERPMSETEAEERVRRWLERGEAYERYLSMNVCRYNC